MREWSLEDLAEGHVHLCVHKTFHSFELSVLEKLQSERQDLFSFLQPLEK